MHSWYYMHTPSNGERVIKSTLIVYMHVIDLTPLSISSLNNIYIYMLLQK